MSGVGPGDGVLIYDHNPSVFFISQLGLCASTVAYAIRTTDWMSASPAATMNSTCPPGSDNQFGPQVQVDCRPFDFTLLFEDGIFVMLPAALFLLLFPLPLHSLRTKPVKLTSYTLALWKLVGHPIQRPYRPRKQFAYWLLVPSGEPFGSTSRLHRFSGQDTKHQD